MNIKNSESVFVALVIQNAKHMRCTWLLSVAFRSTVFSHTISWTEGFSEKLLL